MPYIDQKDTLGFKIEALRYYLENMMGLDFFLASYRQLANESDDNGEVGGSGDGKEKLQLPKHAEKFIPFLHHLIYCEDSHFGS